jgi:hypothetical protein
MEVGAGIGVGVLAVLEVKVAQGITVNAIDGQHDHDGEIGKQKHCVKGVPVVKALEGPVGRTHGLEVMNETVLGRQGQIRGQVCRQTAEYAGDWDETSHKRGEQGEPPRPG